MLVVAAGAGEWPMWAGAREVSFRVLKQRDPARGFHILAFTDYYMQPRVP